MDKARKAAAESGGSVTETTDRREAMEGAHVIYAKSYSSTRHYGDKLGDQALREELVHWCVDEPWFANARPDCRFMHCLPVRRGVEVADRILDGPRSIVIKGARNRLYGADGRALSDDERLDDMTTRLNTNERAIVITALRHALPYLRVYKHKVFVLEGRRRRVRLDRDDARADGADRHPASGRHPRRARARRRAAVDGAVETLGLATQMVEGRRVTDAQTLEVSTMVLNGEINTRIVAMCRALGIPAIGLSGVDGGLIKATKRPPVQVGGQTVDYGFVGDILGLDTSILLKQLDNDLVPIVSPLSADDHGTLLNINADTVAAMIACELKAEKFVMATGAPGILESLEDPRSLISYIDRAGLRRLRDEGKLSGGMLPKVAAIERALSGGVPRVHVISYAQTDSLLLEVFTNEGTGTLVVNDTKALRPEEQAS